MKTLNYFKSVVVMLLLAITSTCFAQDSYREALRKYMTISMHSFESYKKEIVPSLADIAVNDHGYSIADANAIAEKYCDENLERIINGWIEDARKEGKDIASEEDLNAAIAFFSTEEGASALKHFSSFDINERKEELMSKITPDILKIAMGVKPGTLQADAPSDYCAQFKELCTTIKLDEILKHNLQGMDTSGASEEIVKGLAEYFDQNIVTLIMNMCYPTFTADDINSLSNFYKTEAGQKIAQLDAIVAFKSYDYGQKITEGFVKYIEEPQEKAKATTVPAE